jgi:superfamily I DNA/RNA helicase
MAKRELNEEQRAAVEHPIGKPACLVAGAGSGKTTVLTERVRWLIDQNVPPKRIAAITFTNKAAGELLERLGITDETPHDQCPKVSTIHSLALSAIRRNPQGFGLQQKVTPLDDYEQTQLMKKIIERTFPERDKDLNPYAILEKVKFHRARGIGFPDEYTDEVHQKALVEHSGYHALDPDEVRLWCLYQQEKTKNSVVDFDDMIHLVVRRIRCDEKWRAALQRMFDHVLMDEAQDTNPVQWEFVNALLSPDNMNMYVVGDMSQSIYAFSGAVPALLKEYSEGWRDTVPVLYRIARNHRSCPEIVWLANLIQSKMTATIPLKMESWRATKGDKGKIRLLKGQMSSDIANTIGAEIYRDATVHEGTILFRDNCILVRSATQIRDIEGALVRYRIPYIVRGGRGLLQTEEVRDVLAYLRLATNPKDFMALVRAVAAPKRGIGEVALEKIRATANQQFDGDLLRACGTVDRLSLFVDTMRQVQSCKDDPIAALDKILRLTRYRDYIESKYKRDVEKVKSKLDNLERFSELVGNLLDSSEMTTEDLVFQLTLDKSTEDDNQGKVTISTIHGAKGLEWKRVYITNCFEGSLPHKFSMGSMDEIEEERRLLYVATTRPRDICVICVPAMQQNGASTQSLTPSRFLYETKIL